MRFLPSYMLEPGMILGRDIIGIKHNGKMLTKGMALNDNFITHIQQHGYLGAYIIDDISKDIEITETIDQKLFTKGITAVMEEDVSALTSVATQMVSQISRNNASRVDFIDLRAYDDYTYHHSVNVAVYAVMLGKKMGLKEEELKLLSLAGLAHDLGKSRIPEEILNKPGKLTDEEYEVIKRHSNFSYSILSDAYVVPAQVKSAVLCHHENEDGSGYPGGLLGPNIPLFAKIIHAVDVFDALTSKRPYKQPYTPAATYKYMLDQRGKQFDGNILDVMLTCIPAYPLGLDITLENGDMAVVVRHSKDPMRPIVKMISTLEIVDLSEDPRVANLKIVDSGTMQADFAKAVDSLNESRQFSKLAGKYKIVLADVNGNVSQIRQILGDDYELIFCKTGVEVVQQVIKKEPNLLVVDNDLPVVSGLGVIRTVRKTYESDIPIILVASKVSKETILECRQLGKVDCVLKPYNAHYLNERIRAALNIV